MREWFSLSALTIVPLTEVTTYGLGSNLDWVLFVLVHLTSTWSPTRICELVVFDFDLMASLSLKA